MNTLSIKDIVQIDVDYNGQLLIMIVGQEDGINADAIEFDHINGNIILIN